MGALILPSRFAQQPQQPAAVDASNALARGITGVLYPFMRGAQKVGSAGLQPTRNGVGFSTSSPSDAWIVSPTALASSSPTWTMLAILAGNVATTGAPGVTFYAERPNGTQIAKLELNTTSGTVSMVVRDLSGNLANPAGTTDIRTDTGPMRVVVGTRRASNQHLVFLNGKQEGSNSTNVSGSFGATNGVIGSDPQDSSTYLAGASVPLVLVWNRSLSDTEIAEISRNPWQVFKAPPRRLWAAVDNSITGSAQASEGADAATAAGTVAYPALAGSATASEQTDAASAAGTVAYPGIAGAGSASESSDTALASGITDNSISGTTAAAEGADAGAGAGAITNPPITGAGAVPEGADTASGTGTVAFVGLTGAGAGTEAGDAGAATGAVLSGITGAASSSEYSDSANATGGVFSAITGAAAAIERADTATGFDAVPVTKIGGDDVPRGENEERIEVWERCAPAKKRDESLDRVVREAYAKATGKTAPVAPAKPKPVEHAPAPEQFDFDEDDFEVLLLSY